MKKMTYFGFLFTCKYIKILDCSKNVVNPYIKTKQTRNEVSYICDMTLSEYSSVSNNPSSPIYWFSEIFDRKMVRFWCEKCRKIQSDDSLCRFCCQNYFPRLHAHFRPCFASLWRLVLEIASDPLVYWALKSIALHLVVFSIIWIQ